MDTGVANLHSVVSALYRQDVTVHVSDAFDVIAAADRIVLPGVGSAASGMRSLGEKGLVELLQGYDRPMLGICLGMQLMFETLGESGDVGLGVIDGAVEKLPSEGVTLPHMGWNTLDVVQDDPLLEGVATGEYVYFVHSFAAPESDETLATSKHGTRFAAVVRSGNRMGCQFHPERSGATGARILRNFLTL